MMESKINTFRFKSFGERVNEIDIRRGALYHIGHENEEHADNEEETYFHQTLTKWTVLNLTEEFNQFQKKCSNIVTLPQLIHKKDFVIDFLLEKLSIATTLSLQPLLECIIALARDLREDFYSYFQRVLDRLTGLLNTKDAEQLEWTLICLAFLFKTLKPFLKKNITVVFNAVLPLLNEEQYSEEIINFAIECFSYVARDVRNQEKFLSMILKNIEHEAGGHGIAGCGRLFFEIIRGVNGQFHSIATQFLRFLLESITNEKLNQNLLSEILDLTNDHIINSILPQYMGLYWNVFCQTIEIYLGKQNISKESLNEGIQKILKLMSCTITYKNGIHIQGLDILISGIFKVLDELECDDTLKILSKLVSQILMSNAKIQQLDTSRLFKRVLKISNRHIFEEFIWSVVDHSQFELLILPDVIKYSEDYFDDQILELLSKICLRKSIMSNSSEDIENFDKWKKYELVFRKPETEIKFHKIFDDLSINYDKKILASIIVPHTNFENFSSSIENICSLIIRDLKLLNYSEDEVIIQKKLFTLFIIFENLLHLKFNFKSLNMIEFVDSILPLCSQEKYLIAMKLLHLILKSQRNICLGSNNFIKFHAIVTNNFWSPSIELRKVTFQTLNYFNKSQNLMGIYEIFYKFESFSTNVHNYREKILLINKLAPDSEMMKLLLAQNPEIKFDCLKFLLGALYSNFKLLWEPILKMIENYSNHMKIQEFWDIYKIKLEETVEFIIKEQADFNLKNTTNNKNNSVSFDTKLDKNNAASKEILFENEFLLELFNSFENGIISLDYNNYRNLLWSKLHNFGQLIEIKNRDIVSLFLKFVNQEYRLSYQNKIMTWNILENENEITQFDESGDSENELLNEEENLYLNTEVSELETKNSSYKISSKYRKTRRSGSKRFKNKDLYSIKNLVQTLCIKLKVFSHLANPKQVYKESELFEFYLELLVGINPVLQRLALDCIFTYRIKSLTPYRDTLYKIIDEKEFRMELVNFKLEAIKIEHRSELMKILLRILYGKMMTRSTSKQSLNNQARKEIVLRFLGVCEKEEIFMFLEMPFGHYNQFTNNNFSEISDKLDEVFNLKAVWSPKKLQSAINLLDLMRKQFAFLMNNEFLEYMLKLILIIGYVCNQVLQYSDTIKNKMPIVYKNVKISALNCLINFSQHFEEFDWNKDQMNLIMNVFVWPNLNKLPNDSIHSPTPLMRLILTWSYNSKNFQYLIWEKNHMTPFKSLIELLMNEKSKKVVRKTIMEMIEKLLVSDKKDNCIPMETSSKGTKETIVSGLDVVKPCVEDILKRLKMNFNQNKKYLDKKDLNILSMLVNLVEDGVTVSSLLEILTPIIIKKVQNDTSELIEKIIETLSNLIKKLDEPASYLRKIAPLFENVTEVIGRKMLCNLINDMCRNSLTLSETSEIISNLNACDRRWIEQPDYDKRLNTLKLITKKINENKLIDMNLGILTVYNCFYFLRHDKDIGLRDNASELLKILLPNMINNVDNKHDIHYVMEEIILNFLRKSLRDKNENLRNESILLLKSLVRDCSESHQILMDLNGLLENLENDLDFFENITHLQSHWHAKALLKFCNLAKNFTQIPNNKTLTQFILPLATRYLLNEKFINKPALIDAAIETIGVVCQLLPWSHYYAILRFYLQKMRYGHEYQKQIIRIVITILDSFHYDLSGAGVSELSLSMKQSQSNNKIIVKTEDSIKEEENVENDIIEEDDLDLELNEIDDNFQNGSLNEPKAKKIKRDINILLVPVLLAPSAAKKVISTIMTMLIPALNNSISEKTSYEMKHKLNRKRLGFEREEEEILKVPIALAVVKLLQKLPKEIMENSLNGVFMKVTTFLKSPLKSVRMLTRDILKKIMQALGSEYLSMLIDLLTTLLTKGFQVHVLSVTIHGILDSLKEIISSNNLESCLKNILEVSLNDIFGEIAAEKEINKITAHTPEAKPSAKSYLTLHIVARNVSETCLLDLLMPFKEYLINSQSRKVIQKIQECFQKIVTGLVENKNISIQNLLIFIYGTISESIIDLLPGGVKRPPLTEKEKNKMIRFRPDCYLIPEAPRTRSGAVRRKATTNAQANAHVLIEFGLEMFHILLKRKKIENTSYQSFLNPLLPMLKDSLKSQHIRVTTFALKCFTSIWNEKYELNMTEILPDVINEIFKVLHKYSTSGASAKGSENFQLVNAAFKSMVALLRNVDGYEMQEEHISQLLLYIDQDICESERQPIAFSLLKALIHRKIQGSEIHEIMKKISEIAITTVSDFAQDECRTILIFYLMEYPLSKKIDSILKFFTVQMNYEVTSGRISAVKFLQLIVKKFPKEILERKSEFLYLSLGTRLVNEETPECRIIIAECLEQLLARLGKDFKNKLFGINITFLENGDKSSIREMGATLCSRFVTQEKHNFMPRIKECLPVLVNRLYLSNPKGPGRFVKLKEAESDEIDGIDNDINEIKIEEKQRALDHELIQVQNCILKIFEFCPEILNNIEYNSIVDELSYEAQKLLGYEHDWVRLNSTKILSYIIGSLDFDLVSNLIIGKSKWNENNRDYFYLNPETDIKSLVLDLCAQLRPDETNEEMIEEIIKIFLYIANILKNQISNGSKKNNDEGNENLNKINLNWLLRRIRYVIHAEISKAPHSCILRTSIFNWIEGLLMLIEVEMMEHIGEVLLTPLVREMSDDDQNIDPKLKQQAIRIGNKIRKRIGSDIYDKLRANIQTKLMIKRAERKRKIAIEKVNEPILAAKRKEGLQNRKKLAKKRKMDIMKGKLEGKRKKKRKIDEDIF